jgi:Skp family chaperone for outer membrane proteins
MLNTVLNRKFNVPVTTRTPEATLTALRERARHLQAKRAALKDEERRCTEAAQQPHSTAAPRSALESLHARRFAGEPVSDKELLSAENALRTALTDAQRAEVAQAGATAAASRFAEQAATVTGQLDELRAEMRTLQVHTLRERASASRQKLRAATEAFVAELTAHFGDVEGLSKAADALGIPRSLIDARVLVDHAVGEGVFRLPTTATESERYSFWSFDAKGAIAKRAAATHDEIAALLVDLN